MHLITLGEGALYWEKFGHNALWFVDSARGIDEAYNWGMFDFRTPGFAWRYVMGDTRYWVVSNPGRPLLDFYVQADRTIEVQRLNLTESQALRALVFVRENARDENKYYRYDYFRDNCSTRVRDVIDLATDGALQRATDGDTVPRSYRSESLRLMDDLKLAQAGIDLALGRPADRPLSVWESGFIPMRLRDAVRGVRVQREAGASEPLVLSEHIVHEARANRERHDPPWRWPFYLAIGLVIAADLIALSILGERHRTLDVAFRAEVVLWSLATGVLGAGVLFAWTATRHVFWASNENLLLVNPLSLWVAILGVLSFRSARWMRPAAIAAVLVAMGGAAGLVAKGLPGSQDNLSLIGLILPANFAVAFGLWRRSLSTA